ncbi:FCD domain-containing protein [Rubrobacter tropicus]|uniref:FCD domain-containing protein n=1 Tax=Rubrobacter tropicus TaxID=2653851 RepID=A0A6G8Q668_9ACTN|nr:GntR family transcriptional regulator [Rubrobacter tropicus]QIN81950.1 FCD domain-containing protein [Rubrobacter tropicus]
MPVPGDKKRLSKVLMREEVYADLRGWIIDGTLEPGERLRDAELAEALGVSRMPIREAFLRLEDEGLVETSANRWTRVAHVDVEQAKRLYPVILTLESLAIRLAAPRMGEEELRMMTETNERLKEALKAASPVAASEADRAFHRVFVQRSDNPELVKILDGAKDKLRRVEVAYFEEGMIAERSAMEHTDILDALKRGDTERAARAVEDNWRGSLERLLEQLSGVPTKSPAP